jgi:squalene cyclase
VFRLAFLGLAALPALGFGQEAEQQPRTVGQQEVNAAIDRGVRWLLSSQDEDGFLVRGAAGRTALALYALLKSGVEPEHPAVRRALGFLAAHDPQQTYDAAILALVLASLDDPSTSSGWTCSPSGWPPWQLKSGDWAYPAGDGDLSNTQ